jgi:hypothetical protein
MTTGASSGFGESGKGACLGGSTTTPTGNGCSTGTGLHLATMRVHRASATAASSAVTTPATCHDAVITSVSMLGSKQSCLLATINAGRELLTVPSMTTPSPSSDSFASGMVLAYSPTKSRGCLGFSSSEAWPVCRAPRPRARASAFAQQSRPAVAAPSPRVLC